VLIQGIKDLGEIMLQWCSGNNALEEAGGKCSNGPCILVDLDC